MTETKEGGGRGGRRKSVDSGPKGGIRVGSRAGQERVELGALSFLLPLPIADLIPLIVLFPTESTFGFRILLNTEFHKVTINRMSTLKRNCILGLGNECKFVSCKHFRP